VAPQLKRDPLGSAVMRLYARPIWLVSGALAVLLLAGAIASDAMWRASERISVNPPWSIVLELKSMGTPFAEYYRRVRRARSDGPDTLPQALVELAPNALGFLYDTGLYLRFRATGPDDFQLAYAAALAAAGDPENYAKADELVAAITGQRPSWREARWVAVVINYRAERWSDVVKLLTPIVNDPELDEAFSHAAKITLGTALARLGMFAPALSYLEEPEGPIAVAAVRRYSASS